MPVKEKWLRLIATYLETRSGLRAVVLLLDCRRLPGPEELEIITRLQEWRRRVIVVLTKADKLKKSQRSRQQQEIGRSLAFGGITEEELIWFSALTREGRRELWDRLLTVL
jgi:GTP-binding protein